MSKGTIEGGLQVERVCDCISFLLYLYRDCQPQHRMSAIERVLHVKSHNRNGLACRVSHFFFIHIVIPRHSRRMTRRTLSIVTFFGLLPWVTCTEWVWWRGGCKSKVTIERVLHVNSQIRKGFTRQKSQKSLEVCLIFLLMHVVIFSH